MVPIIELLCPQSQYHLKCPFTRTPTRLVIHNTANDAPADNEISYMVGNGNEVSFHYAVDDCKIVQGLPLDRNAWASGDGHGKGNLEGIHIEICYSLSGGPKFDAAEQNTAELSAMLLKKYGWDLDQVTKHQDYDGKYCPHRTLDLGWNRFLQMVHSNMSDKKPAAHQPAKYRVRILESDGQNIRNQPNGAVIGLLPYRFEAEITAESNGWGKLPGCGWIYLPLTESVKS